MNLLHYIQGRRKGKEAHRIEREAMKNPFLAEALEGFDSVAGDHVARIKQMQQQVSERSHPRNRHILLWTSIAASIALLVGISWYLMLQQKLAVPVLSETIPEQIQPDSIEKATIMEQSKKQVESGAIKQEKALQRSVEPLVSPSLSPIIDKIVVVDEDSLLEMEVVADALVAEDVKTGIKPITPELKVSKNESNIEELNHPAITRTLQDRISGVMTQKKGKSKGVQVRGKVVDETGEPLPGVSVTVKNRNIGIVTDASGEFSLNTDDDNMTIVANFIGYQPQEVKVDTSQVLIALHEDTSQLAEVIVIGYGVKKRTSTDGTVGTGESEQEFITPKPTIGRRAYQKYLAENMVRPVDSECADIKGKVKVRFNVDTKGRPYNLQVIQKLCDAADREAMRLITEGSDWTQGNVDVTVTVKF